MRTVIGLFLCIPVCVLRLSACSCGPAGPACAYVSRAVVVFIGTVAFTDHDEALGLRQRTLVKFTVEQGFKGVARGDHEIWVDPGSFTSCYADYKVGDHMLVFGYGGRGLPPDTPVLSVIPGQTKQKPLPQEINREKPPAVYSAPECSGTRLIDMNDRVLNSDVQYLRQYKDGTATPSVRGRIIEDATFGIFGFDPIPGLRGVMVTLTGNGLNKSTATDDSGYYVFANTPAAAYYVTPSLRGYISRRNMRAVEVPPEGCGAADFDMIGSGFIEGTLLDSAAQPAANVRVEVLRLNRDGKPVYYAQKETRTNENGRYQFNELPSGDFEIGVNLFRPPDPQTPYVPTRWYSPIHLSPGERKEVAPVRLPSRVP
jgi:hypothetical protein